MLTCNQDGTFTILVIGDPQLDWPEVAHEGPEEIGILLKRVSPDLVVLNGDIKTINDFDEDYLSRLIAPIEERQLPWAYVTGNHDRFTEEHHRFCTRHRCLSTTVPADDPDYEEDRPLNFVLPIYTYDGKRQVFAVWGMDTGMYNKYGWEGLTHKQIRWYQRTSDAITASCGEKVTGLLCCHIPFPQVVDLYYSKKDGGVVRAGERGDKYPVWGRMDLSPNGRAEVTENGTKILEQTGFNCTNRMNDRGMFKAICEQGDIKIAVFSHEHNKNFVGNYNGVLLGYSGKISMGCGAVEYCRGGRVIRFRESAPEAFETYWVGSVETSEDLPPVTLDKK